MLNPLLSLSIFLARADTCPAIKVAPRQMRISTSYLRGDSTYSKRDGAIQEQQSTARAPIRDPIVRISALADKYRLASSERKPEVALCLQRHLVAQANAGAMMEAKTPFDFYYREWMISSLALSYLKAKTILASMADAEIVRTWLLISAKQIEEFNKKEITAGRIDNHRYWGGLAVMATGMAINDPGLTNFGREVRRLGLSQIAKDGTLPAECRRGRMSLHYHLFAAAPLATMVSIDPAIPNVLEVAALRRLANRIVDDAGTGGTIASIAGTRQISVEHPVLFRLLGPYVESRKRKKLAELIGNQGMSYQFLGGDISNLLTIRNY